MISECDGGLYDTRKADWSKAPIRPNYSRTHREIKSALDCKATLRAGGFAWPGGYPLFLVTYDGAALCFDCARKNWRNIAGDYAWKMNSGWRVVACDINYEDDDCFCANCSKQIKPAYGS